MKYTKYILVFVLLISLFLGTIPQKSVKKTEYMLDTVISITAYGKNAKKAVDEAFNEIKRLDNLLNAFSPESEISKINQNASNGFVSVNPEVYHLIKYAVGLSNSTFGAFDITLKPVSDLWGFNTENAHVPKSSEIEAALKKTGTENLEFDDNSSAIRFKLPEMAIDLGAVAKGYASSRAAQTLKANGVENAILDLGGNICTIGKRPLAFFEGIANGGFYKPFKIGIQNPTGARGESIHTITAEEDICVITSGSYERYFEENGKRYHHIIDPKTGRPSENGINSATIVSKEGALGDALSTAAFVLGKDGIEKITPLCDLVIIIDSENKIFEYRKD